jgi:hypothetical protein
MVQCCWRSSSKKSKNSQKSKDPSKDPLREPLMNGGARYIGGGGFCGSGCECTVDFGTVKAVLALLMTDRKLQLMAMTQVSFGFYIAFLNFYINGTVTPQVLSKAWIGCMASCTVTVGATVSFFSPWISANLGRK